jgi:DNA adenine methylase
MANVISPDNLELFDIESRIKPVLKWVGGKSGILDQIIPFFPKSFGRYIEPFTGGGAVLFALRIVVPSIINDLNPELVNLYAVLRDNPVELMKNLDSIGKKYSEDFYYALRGQRPQSPVKRAARTFFLNKTGFNGLYRQNSRGKFNVPFGKRDVCPALYDRENIYRASIRLRFSEIRSADFADVIAEAGVGDFVYCDPPYEPVSQTSNFTSYTRRGFSQDDQRRLVESCQGAVHRGACVAISNSYAGFIRKIYAPWNLKKIYARRAINSNAMCRGKIPEVLCLMG